MATTQYDAALGAHIKTYRKSFVLPIALLLTLAVPVYFLISAGMSHRESIIPILLSAALMCPAIFKWLTRIKYRLHLFESGLVQTGILGEDIILFSPAIKIWHSTAGDSVNGIPSATYFKIKISDEHHTMQLGSSIVGIKELRDQLIQYEINVIEPAMREAYASGKAIDFSALQIKKDMVFVKSISFKTSDVAKMKLQNGVFAIWQNGHKRPFCKVRVEEISNMFTFLGIFPSITPAGAAQSV